MKRFVARLPKIISNASKVIPAMDHGSQRSTTAAWSESIAGKRKEFDQQRFVDPAQPEGAYHTIYDYTRQYTQSSSLRRGERSDSVDRNGNGSGYVEGAERYYASSSSSQAYGYGYASPQQRQQPPVQPLPSFHHHQQQEFAQPQGRYLPPRLRKAASVYDAPYQPQQQQQQQSHQEYSYPQRHHPYQRQQQQGPVDRYSWRPESERRFSSTASHPSPSSSSSSSPYPRTNNTGLQRRKKLRATQAPAPPCEPYLAQSLLPSLVLSPAALAARPPPLIILDLNNTLLFRPRRSTLHSQQPLPRDYLQSFLEYLCGSTIERQNPTLQRRFTAVVYSSARRINVARMCTALRLIPVRTIVKEAHYVSSEADRAIRGVRATSVGTATDAVEGPLKIIFSREMMGLTASEFSSDIETFKDLSKVWEQLDDGRWDATSSVLLDDDAGKCCMQPYSHLPITAFELDPQDLPQSAPPSPLRLRRSTSPPAHAATSSVDYSLSSAAQDLPKDTALLSTITLLEALKVQSNLASFVREGGIARIRAEKSEAELAEQGRKTLEQLGIIVSRAWRQEWSLV